METHPGRQLFAQNCLACHSGAAPKAPAVVWLEMLEPDVVLSAMHDGIMQQQAAHLSDEEQMYIAEYLVRSELDDYQPPAPPPFCENRTMPIEAAPPARVGWGHDNSRFVSEEIGGLTGDEVSSLTLKWAFAFPGAIRARSQPAVGWNTVFVGSQSGKVYAFDLEEGCARWTYRAGAEVRTAIVADADEERLYFGDILGRVYAIDAMSGEELWRTQVDDHANATITGTPTLGGGHLVVPISSLEVTSAADPNYSCCTFRGSVVALDPATGERQWKTHTVPEEPVSHGVTSAGAEILGPSGAPVWNSPTYDAKRDRFYFGSGENYSSPADENSDALFAVDARTGRKVWQVQFTRNDAWNVGCMMGNENCPEEDGPDLDIAASAILTPLDDGSDIIVVGQKSGVVHGVDPDSGEIVWQTRLGHGGTQGGVHFGMARQGQRIFVPIADLEDTHDGRVYDASINGAGIHAVDAATGDIQWRNHANDICDGEEFCDPGISAAATAIPGAVIAGHLDGRLRAYDSRDGRVLWSYDTRRPVMTVTGQQGTGGGMSGPGPAIYNGHLIANSGYGLYFHLPGNVLLVFEKQS
ncbi:PQQ-binding-like beta-propeller repeat protein [Aurantiacibacter odishensis]|uniref:outer membrane protein assembly factor BamB family protein n=1 Tax=Aurantiacibacter odishensis TaxID=1155476 RepID=UPI001F0BFC49|nr:PQQ-binding-like beta-propeller repeat protein [Aurantiacibacter odishensis]